MRKGTLPQGLVGAAILASASGTQAAVILLADTDPVTAGLQQNPNFTFGNGQNTVSTSTSISTAFGRPAGAGAVSVFGGNGVPGDRYIFVYDPSSQADNLVVPAGQALGNGNLGTGVVGGGAGVYNVYATWPATTNVNPGPVKYDVSAPGSSFSTTLNQNGAAGTGGNNAWVLLGQITYTSGTITVDQQPDPPNTNFTSMRMDALLFERTPEPTTLVLLGVGGLFLRRRTIGK